MKRAVPSGLLFLFLAYLVSYMAFRATHTEVWKKNEVSITYVIFPKDKPYLYFFYRPVTYVDGAITGMRFHLGPHE